LRRNLLRCSIGFLAVVAVADLSGQESTEKTSFQVTRSTLDSLPVLANLTLGLSPDSVNKDEVKIIVTDLGRRFFGESMSGVLMITNSSMETLVIESVKASCGCTTAVPVERRLPPGGATQILLKIAFRKAGKFEVEIRIDSNLGERTVQLHSTVESRVSLVSQIIEVEKDATTANAVIVVNDDSIEADSLRLLDEKGGNLSLVAVGEPRTFGFAVPLNDFDSLALPLALRATDGNSELALLNLTVRKKGRFRVVPGTVFAQATSGQIAFRFFVVGDASEIPKSATMGTLELQSKVASDTVKLERSVELKIEQLGHSVLVKTTITSDAEIENEIPGGAFAILRLQDLEFEFELIEQYQLLDANATAGQPK